MSPQVKAIQGYPGTTRTLAVPPTDQKVITNGWRNKFAQRELSFWARIQGFSSQKAPEPEGVAGV